MFFIEMQFIPNLDVAWVMKLNPDDEVYKFENYDDAYVKMLDLQEKDITGRKYRISQIAI